MPSIFTKIMKGDIPCHKVFEDARHFSFMEIRPLKPGHTLVIPRQETDYFFDLDEKALGELMACCKKISAAIKKATGCEKVAMVVYGLAVRHAHVHLIPVDGTPGELDFRNQRDAAPSDLAAMAAKITSCL